MTTYEPKDLMREAKNAARDHAAENNHKHPSHVSWALRLSTNGTASLRVRYAYSVGDALMFAETSVVI